MSRSNILLYTNMRSGSSFVGNLFSQNPDIFYLFEPFKFLEQETTIKNANHLTLIAGSNDFKYHKQVEQNISDYLLQFYDCSFGPFFKEVNKLQKGPKEQREIKQWYAYAFGNVRFRFKKWPPDPSAIDKVCESQYKHLATKVIRGELLEHIFPIMEKGVKVSQ